MSVPVVRHLLVCGRVQYDPQVPLAPYSLRNLIFRHRLPDGATFPVLVPELWLFVRLDGRGDHEPWIDVAAVGRPNDLPTRPTTAVATYGPFPVRFGQVRKSLSRGWCLRSVPFPEAGWYEFRIQAAGRLVAREPIYLED